jgi:hypothetical protein
LDNILAIWEELAIRHQILEKEQEINATVQTTGQISPGNYKGLYEDTSQININYVHNDKNLV